jgi:thymidylate synthase ThyX
MTISASVIADSSSAAGRRLTTVQCRYPKFIHGELMTHRVFSRNASSSRAIPVERLIKDVLDDPVRPSFWGKNQKGMQAAEECDSALEIFVQNQDEWENDHTIKCSREQGWDQARNYAVKMARAFAAAGYHKQIVNRLLEPFCHINVLITATEWDNFFALRCHPDAQPEMRLLAEAIRNAMAMSTPTLLERGDWHLPYVGKDEWRNWPQDLIEGGDGYSSEQCRDNLIKLSVARCARVSYLTQEGHPPRVDDDLKLYERLVGAVPLHASPAEHQATPDTHLNEIDWPGLWRQPRLHGNLVGWVQYRKLLELEHA